MVEVAGIWLPIKPINNILYLFVKALNVLNSEVFYIITELIIELNRSIAPSENVAQPLFIL